MEIRSTPWWESRLAERLHVLVAIVALLLLLRLAMEEDLAWLAGTAIAVAVCILTSVRWPYGALLVVIGMSAMPYYFVELFGWKARPEHFAAVIVFAAVCIWLLFSKQRLRLHKLDYWILSFIAINFISSGFGSSAPSLTLRWALQNSLAVLAYFLIRVLIRDRETLRKAFVILLAVGIVESIYGMICYASRYLFGTTFGMSVGQYLVDVSAPYASMYEPNLFGSYVGCCAVMCLAAYLLGHSRITSAIGFLIAALGTVLSYSRGALAGLILAALWVFWKTRHSRNAGSRVKLVTPLLAFFFIFVIAIYAAGGVFQKRFENLYYQGLTEETALVRFLVIQEALMDIPGHFLIGNGTASFNLSFDWNRYIPEWASDKTWIGNTPIRVMHDTGFIGLCVFFGFFVTVWWKLRRAWKKEGVWDGTTLGLVAGLLLYGVSFEFTDGSILAFFWVHLGFLASAVILGAENLPAHDLNNPTAIE
jgi:hypothetical protein